MYKLSIISAQDEDFIKKGLSDPLVYQYYGVRLTDETKVKEQMKWYQDLVDEKNGQWWIISSSTTNVKCGAIGINDVHLSQHKAELGFWLLPEFWGNGIIVRIFPEFLQTLKQFWPLECLVAYVEKENERSKKVLLNLGFCFKGTLPRSEIKADQWIDLDVFQLSL